MLHSVHNVMFHGIPIYNANTGTDLKLHAVTEHSEEDQREREESECI